MSYIIIPIKPEPAYFNNESHLNNFVRYLFSETQKHPTTDKTKKNYYKFSDKEGFLENNTSTKKSFTSKAKLNEIGHDNLYNELTYFYFSFTIGKTLVSNFMRYDDVKDEIIVDNGIFGIAGGEYEMNKKIYHDSEPLEKLVNEQIQECEKIVHFDDVSDKIREQIEKTILKYIGKSGIISISHNDQEDNLYHVHQIYER